ncbi:hypothetical protein RB2150_14981 [Rhodobacteraceae bacterium HTCC2150]|nr:hypothetical protein RB2150_14981 [Rhodobacteraceae bacterium HTCC2150]
MPPRKTIITKRLSQGADAVVMQDTKGKAAAEHPKIEALRVRNFRLLNLFSTLFPNGG